MFFVIFRFCYEWRTAKEGVRYFYVIFRLNYKIRVYNKVLIKGGTYEKRRKY